MKPALAAFVSLLVGALLGYAAFVFFAPGGFSGRDFTPLLAFAALCMFGTGLVHGRVWLRGVGTCAAGIAGFVLLVGAAVRWFSGAGVDTFMLGWLLFLLLPTLLPWLAGAWAGRWSRRFQLTP
jgi:hypothetical protein